MLNYNTYLFEAKEGESGTYWDMYVRHFPPEFQESIMNLHEATRNEAKLETRNAMHRAIELLKTGTSVDKVAEETNLPKEEVEYLKDALLH